MCVRKLALALGLVGALAADMAAALGLGEIKLNSTLNQPLDAEIKLLQVRSLTPEEILVSLASREDFDRAGVERLFFLSDLRFKVLLDHPSGPLIRVTTRKPVREPYLNFLLETQWPSGRLLREYTLLMDLPVFGDEKPQPVQGVTTRQPERPAAVPAPQPVQPAQPAPQPSYAQPQPPGRATPSRSVDVYGPVTRNDTLWEIALRVRPDRSVSVQQTMLALQRLNPGAFINDNINLLRRGQVLRVPSLEEIYSMSAQQAVAEVAYQNSQWQEGVATQVTGAQLDAARNRSSGSVAQRSGEGRVKLGAPGDVEGSDSGRGAGSADGDTEALQNELAITLEELDKTKRDNDELTSRISELEAQIETMERLVEVSQEEMRALQLASQQQAQAGVDAAATVVDTPGEVTEDPALAAVTPEPAEQATPEPAAATPAAADAKKVVRTPQPQPQPKSFIDILMDNIIWVGAALAAILGAAFFVMRRRAEAVTEGADIDEFDHFDEQVFAGEDEVAPDVVEETEDFALDPEPEVAEEPEDTEIAAAESEPVEAETSDVVGEADIYIAYGKFDQAEDMLRKVLVDNPSRTDVRTKLLEVFSESNQLQKFDQEYAQLLTFNDTAANERAAELRSNIPDAGEFDPNAAAEPVASELGLSAEDDGDLSLELDLDEQSSGGQAADFDDIDLDLDLDTDLESDSQLDVSLDLEESSGDTAAADGGFDLELDLDDQADTGTDDASLALEEDLGDGDLSLDLDLSDAAEGDLDLTLDELEEDSAAADSIDEDLELSLPAEADDLETAAAETDGGQGVDDFQDEFGDSLDGELDDDDFDLDMGDVDMAALDQEVDELAADLDVDDDADVSPAMAEPVTEFDEPVDAVGAQVEPVQEAGAAAANDAEEGAEEVFSEVLSAVPDSGAAGGGADLSDENAELDFLADTDEAATKLDLARAYIDMGDKEGAKDILDEVAEEGNDQQRQEAQELLSRM